MSCGLGRVGKLAEPLSLGGLRELSRKRSGWTLSVWEAAGSPGPNSGCLRRFRRRSLARALKAGADTFVTGDVKYHTAQDIAAAGRLY